MCTRVWGVCARASPNRWPARGLAGLNAHTVLYEIVHNGIPLWLALIGRGVGGALLLFHTFHLYLQLQKAVLSDSRFLKLFILNRFSFQSVSFVGIFCFRGFFLASVALGQFLNQI